MNWMSGFTRQSPLVFQKFLPSFFARMMGDEVRTIYVQAGEPRGH